MRIVWNFNFKEVGVVKAKKKGKCTITLRTFNVKSTKVKIKVK